MARALLVATVLLALAGCGGAEEQADAPPAATTSASPTATEDAGPEAETAPAVETTVDSQPAPTEPEPEAAPEPEPEALPGLPRALAGYERWPKLNARPIPPRSADPHLSTKNVYSNAAPADGVYPNGAIVVKEGIRPGTDFVGLVAMMRKQRGAQPDHNDWVWIEWVRNAPGEEFREQARGAVCYGCHVGARDSDYVFTR